MASGPSGSVPRETAGRFEIGKPETGETPGWAGSTLRPGGRLPVWGALALFGLVGLFGLPGDSVLSTERLGIDGFVFGVAGAAVVPEPVAVVDDVVCPLEERDVEDDVEPLVGEPAGVPALPPELPLPPPVPPLP